MTGGLGAWRDGQFLGVVVYPENGPIIARPDGGDRINRDDSLYFYLPGDWVQDGALMLKAMVYQNSPNTPEDFELNAENNFIEREVSFQPSEAIKLRLLPVHVHSSPNQQAMDVTYTYQDQQTDALTVLLNIYRIFPISNLIWDAGLEFELQILNFQLIIPAMVSPSSHGNGVEWDLSKSDDRDEVNARIALLKAFFSADYVGWNWYGVVEPTVSMGNFSGWANSGVAHGQMNPTTSGPAWYVKGGNTLAHEVGHNRGLAHNLCKGNEESGGSIDPDYPYPFLDCSIAAVDPDGYYGFDIYWPFWGNILDGPTVMSNDPGVASPNQAFPFMGYQSPKWADPFNYCKLLDALGVACEVANINVRLGTSATDLFAVLQGSGGGPTAGPRHDHASQAPAPGVSSVSQTANGHVFVSVSVDTALTRGRIIDVMPIVAPAAAVLEAEQRRQAMIALGSDLRLRFEDAGGQSLATHVLAPIDPEQHELAQETRLYAELFELPEGTARVILVAGRTILAERVASASAPVVEIIAPSGGGGLTTPLDIEWQASDADGDELQFTLLYSADDGET